jgi:hypothetical protein
MIVCGAPCLFSSQSPNNCSLQSGTEIRLRKDDNKIKEQTDIDRHGPKPSSNRRQPPNPNMIAYCIYNELNSLCFCHFKKDISVASMKFPNNYKYLQYSIAAEFRSKTALKEGK